MALDAFRFANQAISLMGSGNSMFSQGTGVNEGSFGQSALFGTGLASARQAPITATKAASTADLGYQDLADSSPGTRGMPMQAGAPAAAARQLNAPKGMKPAIGGAAGMMLKSTAKKLTPATAPGQAPPEPAGVLAGAAVRGVQSIFRGGVFPPADPAGRNDNFAYGQSSSSGPGGGMASDDAQGDATDENA